MTEEKETTRICICPECSCPLFSESLGVDQDKDLTCGVCGWKAKAKDALVLEAQEWRNYLFGFGDHPELPPLARNMFYMSASERIAGLIPSLGLFLVKWAVLSDRDLEAPWINEVFKKAALLFFQEIAAGVSAYNATPEEDGQQELPLEEEK